MTAFDNDRWEAERKARLERVNHMETEMTDTTPMEQAMKAAREVTEMFGREEQVVRAVLEALRDNPGDAAMCAETPLGPSHRYGQWVAAIDAILAEDKP